MKVKLYDRMTGISLKRAAFWPDLLIALLMGILLYVGCSGQIFSTSTDAAKYQCYTVAFWQGVDGFNALPKMQCDFILGKNLSFASSAPSTTAIVQYLHQAGMPSWFTDFVAAQSPTQSFHALPHEYPFLNVFVFSLGLIVPTFLFQTAYAIWMILFAIAIYFVLLRYRSRGAAIACALYFVAGGWGTLAGRYDLVPAAFTLFALFCALKDRWKWAFALLAVATLLKLYPILLLPFFLLAQQKVASGRWYVWSRWAPLAVFTVICGIVMCLSLLLSVEGTLAPFTYFIGRPIQAESFSASLLWLVDLFTRQLEVYVHTFGSLNVLSSNANWVSFIAPILEAVGLLYLLWLQLCEKTDLATSILLTLLIILLTGKVFSPQYLIWVIPMLAYIGQAQRRWLIPISIMCLLTTAIFPYLYMLVALTLISLVSPFFPPVVAVRNFLLFGITIALFIYYSRQKPVAIQRKSE